MDHPLNLIFTQTRKVRSNEHVVEIVQTFDRGVDGRKWIIGAKQDFLPHAVLLHEHQAVIKLKGPIVQRADVGKYIWMFPNNRDAFTFIRVAEVRHDDLHVRKADRHRIEMARQGAFDGGLPNECRAGVQQDGKLLLLGIFPERPRRVVGRARRPPRGGPSGSGG